MSLRAVYVRTGVRKSPLDPPFASLSSIISPLVKGGMGGFTGRMPVPLTISQSFGDCHGLTASQ